MKMRVLLPIVALCAIAFSVQNASAFELLNRMMGHRHGGCCAPSCCEASCCEEPTCCAAAEPTCCEEPTCCAAEPTCCEAPSCCEDSCNSCCRRRPVLNLLRRIFHHNRCCQSSCCEATCAAEPTCGCN